MLRRAGLALRDDDKDDWDDDYARAFERTPLFSHAVYGLLVILALEAGLRRWRRGDRDAVLIANLALCACAILFVAGFFVISIACDYRYLYFLDVAAMAAITREASAGFGGNRSTPPCPPPPSPGAPACPSPRDSRGWR
jgi:hypothetical protein